MAGKLRYWKEKDDRFWARIAVPAGLRPFLDNPRGELIEPLGGDRRVALRLHPAAVAKLQQEIASAEQKANLANPAPLKPASPRTPITTADFGRAVWQRYTATLATDDATRKQFPSKAEIDAEYERLMQRIDAGEISGSRDPIGMINAYGEYEMMLIARQIDAKVRGRRLAVLLSSLASGVSNPVDADIRQYITENKLIVEPGSAEWRELGHGITRAEVEALKRTLERDNGDYTGQPSDPIVQPPATRGSRRSGQTFAALGRLPQEPNAGRVHQGCWKASTARHPQPDYVSQTRRRAPGDKERPVGMARLPVEQPCPTTNWGRFAHRHTRRSQERAPGRIHGFAAPAEG